MQINNYLFKPLPFYGSNIHSPCSFLFTTLCQSRILSFSLIQVQWKWKLYSHQKQIAFTACEIYSWCFAFRSITVNVPESKTSTICSIRHWISVALHDLQRQGGENNSAWNRSEQAFPSPSPSPTSPWSVYRFALLNWHFINPSLIRNPFLFRQWCSGYFFWIW